MSDRSQPRKETTTGSEHPDFVVGIGASAGGLEALEGLFHDLPGSLGMAYVIVQHLSPDFESLMDELLRRKTDVPVFQAEDGLKLQRDCIYLLPPRKEIAISNMQLILKEKDSSAALSFPIDGFFRSLANDAGDKAIAIVLSGTGSDGSRGICDIHDNGGLVIVQSEDSAKFNGMPRSAADSGIPDLILPPKKIREALERYRETPRAENLSTTLTTRLYENGLQKVLGLVRDQYGLDLSNYKPSTIIRRMERRLAFNSLANVEEYAELVATSSQELEQLYRDLLIGVTRFFRDTEAFDSLRKAMAELLSNAKDDTEFRIWSTGCSTGQEPYTIAMIMDSLRTELCKSCKVKIFATDIDSEAVAFAKQGLYTAEQVCDLPEGYLERFFTPVGDDFQVTTRLRQMIVFAPHNLLRDAPFTNIDLICCRNMLIYMNPKPQRKVLSLFYFGLKPKGILFLGPSETTTEIAEEFEPIDARWRIFTKKRDARLPADFRMDLQPRISTTLLEQTERLQVAPKSPTTALYDALLSSVMPPSFLVTPDEGRLKHTFGNAGLYLKSESGRHTNILTERLSDGLRSATSAGIRKASRDRVPIDFGSIKATTSDGNTAVVSLSVKPIIVGDELNSILVQVSPEKTISDPETPVADSGAFSREHIETLEAELQVVKQNLQATIEELETSNEEMQATNEEMLASNEELQSTNEELHSVNEELYTVNAEHQSKIMQLSEVTHDMDNLLHSTEVHTIFLDRDLQIRKFTPQVAETFSLIPQDIGRRIDSFTHSIDCEALTAKLESVIETRQPHEEEVCDRSGAWFLMRLLPYRAANKSDDSDKTEGALLTLVDISKLRATSAALEDSVRKRDQFLAMLSHELRNPLATILNATKVMSRQDPKAIGESLAVIHRQSNHMALLLNDLLDVTRVSQGKIHLQRRKFDLQRAISGAVESVRSRCNTREQEINLNGPTTPIWIKGSEPRLLQVLSNLLTNASKYSAPGEDIDIRVHVDDENAHITVRDYGVGIRKEQMGGIFELFVQSDHTLDRADGGLGIGLTLAKSLIELHHGKLTVYSDGEGKGSEFTVTLPRSGAPDPTPQPENKPGEKSETGRVVLVEDNIDATKMLAFLLEDAGYQVFIANDGLTGVKLIQQIRPDSAIVDIGLPEIDGYEVARRVRSDNDVNRTHLIALTGYGQASDREAALNAGFDEHLVKPIDPDQLDQLLVKRRSVSGRP
ncbi:MAG: CheR family methyltransferase [Pirellulaceae bacterium]